ncbi:hypothetical protein VTN77DRAFT_695 [Rasamsonia byssochlamydoides]|uniref:uncharacterized protein n=1 Tax=Rasamsonia byssochlamydoides TaxID=89139 RepID=UPI0037425223
MGLSALASKSKATGRLTLARLDRPLVLSSSIISSSSAISVYSITQVQHRRTLWGWGRQDWRDPDRFWQRLEKLERRYILKQARLLRQQAELSQKLSQKLSHVHPWWGWGWGWRRFQSYGPDHNTRQDGQSRRDTSGKEDLGEQNWREAERARFDREFEQLKKEIEADPYNFLFGKSNEWLGYRDKRSTDWTSLCRSFLGYHEAPKKAQELDTNPSKGKETASPETTKGDKVIESSEYQESTASTASTAVHENTTKATTDTILEFDPVSGRMVPKKSQTPEVAKDAIPKDDGAVDIPVKTFKSYRAQFGYGTDTNEGSEKLKQEDDSANKAEKDQFDPVKNGIPDTEGLNQEKQKPDVLYLAGPEKDIDSSPSSAVGQGAEASVQADIEPSSSTIKNKTATSSEMRQGVHNFKEIKDDDVDLLRASDIRASYSADKTQQEIAEKKKLKLEALERDFNSYKDPESDLNVEEIRANAKKHESLQVPESQADEVRSSTTPTLHIETSATQPVEQSSAVEARGSESELALKARPDNDSVSLQQTTSVSSDNELPQSDKSAVPDDLSREIRDIYESSYGEITPQHRQGGPTEKITPSNSLVIDESQNSITPRLQTVDARLHETLQSARKFTETAREVTKELMETCEQLEISKRAPKSSSPQTDGNSPLNTSPTLPATYRVLAYDSSTLQVVIAETTSSVYSAERTLHPAEVLSRLNSPAKFLPHFAKMQADGYEIVSGGGDILVFKKVREPGTSSMTAGSVEPTEQDKDVFAAAKINSAESRLQEQQGIPNKVDRDQHITQPEQPVRTSPSSSPGVVHRQETVYTGGPPNSSPYPPPPTPEVNTEMGSISHEKSSFGKTARRILLTGFATAATCYAIGVVCEYFRTGGQDGLGPEGFTEFEAERRRRE